MFGWEFPPFSYGGLGTACHGIVSGLSHQDIHLTLVLPQARSMKSKTVHIAHADDLLKGSLKLSDQEALEILQIDSALSPYSTPKTYVQELKKILQRTHKDEGKKQEKSPYGKDLCKELNRYAKKAYKIGKKHNHDVIHAHDWLTMPAGVMAKKASGKPLVSHIHATEFDRTGGNPNQQIYEIEKHGMQNSDHIIAVSEFTKQKIIKHYGISANKISVVHNAVIKEKDYFRLKPHIGKKDHVVLFLGRMTLQKGPEYFLQMAKRVVEHEPHTKFVMAGNGDMMHRMIHYSSQLGIAKHVLFAGYLSGPEIDQAYAEADLYVMPSVSEPFGITPLEAIRNGTPVLMSKQSGVSEIISNALKVDFWDIEEMTNKVLATLRYSTMKKQLSQLSQQELHRLSWRKQAEQIYKLYHHIHTTDSTKIMNEE